MNGQKEKLLEIFEDISILDNKAKLVANSKLLHFLLPNLAPIVDKEYIVRYFKKDYNSKQVNLALEHENDFYSVIFDVYHDVFRNYFIIGKTPLKIIDNAIVNHVRKQMGK